MHEHSLISGLIRQVEEIARQQRATKVTGIRVKIGALAHMSPRHLLEHFVDAARGTSVEGAKLESELLTDCQDPRAQEIVLESIEVED